MSCGSSVIEGCGDFDYDAYHTLGCPPGSTCDDAVDLVAVGPVTLTQAENNFWHKLTPEANGMYEFSSCGAECNTTLYIYDYCSMGNFDDTNEGSIYYDDNQIARDSLDGSCSGFDWSFNYVGPPADEACNYNPSGGRDASTRATPTALDQT